jgi:hypothetical protein
MPVFVQKTNVARSDPFRMDVIPLPVSTGEKGTTNKVLVSAWVEDVYAALGFTVRPTIFKDGKSAKVCDKKTNNVTKQHKTSWAGQSHTQDFLWVFL